ncbi:10739_t:CDS:2, partial [Racocetra fulgida]
MTFEKHNTINCSQHEMNSLHYTNSSHNNEGCNNETQNCDEVKQQINTNKPKFLPENVNWDGNVEVADIDWSVSFMKPSTGLPTYPINMIDFSDGKIRERDIQWPDNNDNLDNNFQQKNVIEPSISMESSVEPSISVESSVEPSISVESSVEPSISVESFVESSISVESFVESSKSVESFVESSKSVESFVESSISVESFVESSISVESSVEPSIPDLDTTSSAIIDLAHEIKSIAINDDDIEFSEICTQEVTHNSINDVYDLYGDSEHSELFGDSEHSELYGEDIHHVNETDSWSESSHTLQTKDVPDQNNSESNAVQYSSKSNYTMTYYIRRRRRPRSYLEQRKDPRYNPDANHWKSDADYLSFDGQERIDPEKRENEKYDAVIQAALDAWGAHKDVTMDVFKTKPTKDMKKSNAIIFEEDDRGDIVPPIVLYNQDLPPKETPRSKSPIISPQTCPVDSSSSQSVVLHQCSQSKATSLPFVFHGQSYVSPLLQALYEGNIAQANSVAKYLDGFKIDLSPILSIELPADIEIEVRQNSKWPAYYADVDNLQNEINTLYNRQIDHLKDTRIDLLKRIKERFTFMSDYYFHQSAHNHFKKQLSPHKSRKTNHTSRDVELKDLMNWLLSDNNTNESLTHRPFKFSSNKKPLHEILSSNLENLFADSSTDLYSKIMFSSIEELEKNLSFDDDDSNDLDNIYSPNIEESRFINNLINRLPQDQKFLFDEQNQSERFPNDLNNDIDQFWHYVTKDIWDIQKIRKISIDERKLYRHMFNRIVSNYYDPIITNIYTNAIELNNNMDEKRLQKLSEVMKGAPCLKKLFHDSSPASTPVFIVDEASEIPEDEISCIINDHENLEHLVMIGDMNRRCGNSLFERWISNG